MVMSAILDLVTWVLKNGVTIPLLLYVAYHIKWGRIREIYDNMGGIIKVLIAVAQTNDDIKEDAVQAEFASDRRTVTDYIEDGDDAVQSESPPSVKQQD